MPILVRQKMIACSGSSASQDLDQPVDLLARRDLDVGLLDRVHRELLRRDPDGDRVVHVAVGEPLDRGRDRGREQRRLPTGRADPQDSLDVLDEARDRASRRPRRGPRSGRMPGPASPAMIRSSVRPTVATTTCAACAQPRLLGRDRLAAEHRDDLDRQVLGVGAQGLGDLDAELAGRGEDERLGLVGAPGRGTGASAVRSGSLAGPGLRLADHVVAGEELRDRLLLDRRSDPRSRARRACAGSPRTGRVRGRTSRTAGGSETPRIARRTQLLPLWHAAERYRPGSRAHP